jgi:tripartite-type tricarboxylate transporter receptor subunit TctC
MVVVENRPGAGGNLGAEAVVKADPDGYTLLMATVSSAAINYSLYGTKMPYKPEDLAAVGLMMEVPNAIFVSNALPVKTLQELVDYARAHPGKLNNGSSGIGTSLHLTGELLKAETGIEMQHIPFRGAGPMLQEAIAGRIEVGVDNLPSVLGHLKEGRLRPLAVTGTVRAPALPDVPTTAQAGFPGVVATAWFGVQVPARTPRPVIEQLGAAVDAVTKDPEVKAKIAELGGSGPNLPPRGGTTPAAFETYTKAEIIKWSEVVRKSGAKAE